MAIFIMLLNTPSLRTEGEARHCERSEAIQRPFLASHKATGLLR